MSRQNQPVATSPSLSLELWAGVAFLVLGGGLLAAARFGHGLARGALPLELGAVLLVAAAGFLAAWLTARARRRGRLAPRTASPSARRKPLHPLLQTLRDAALRAWLFLANIDWVGDWLAVGLTCVLGVVALLALRLAWISTAPPPGPLFDELTVGHPGRGIVPAAGAGAPLCRPAADGIRRGAAAGPHLPGDAAGLSGPGAGGRAALAGLFLLRPVEHAVIVVTALIAAEIVLRSLIFIFVPLPPLSVRRSHADSAIAGLIRAQLPSFSALSASMRRQFGIDLARSWALGFIRRATVPLLLGMALFSWLLTGVTALGLNERAVYEAFGQPQGVLHSGIHLHWPWPFGILRPVEYGRVQEIPVEYVKDDAAATDAVPGANDTVSDIEGRPPASADRLWDNSHPQEVDYIVAAQSEGRASFEAVDIDLSVVYRIGLSDQAAQQAAYNIAVPEALIRSTASQMLARYFARATIGEILGRNRETFIRQFQARLQARMTALNSGVDIMAIVVEGIHPPPKAAAAYQGVQAAAIASAVRVNTAGAESAREMKMAGLVATSTTNDAEAAAEERIDAARRDFTLFDGDRQAYQAGGEAFLFERRLDRLHRGLLDKPLIIVDHRIQRAQGPTVNLVSPRAGAGGSNLTPSDD